MWGKPVHSGWEDALSGDLWFGKLDWKEQLSIGASNLPLSDLTLRPTLRQSLQTGCSLDTCAAEATLPESLDLRSQRNKQNGTLRPQNIHLVEDRSSLEPPGQEVWEYKHCLKRIVLIPQAKALYIVEITTRSHSHAHTILKQTQRHACTLSAQS